MQDTSKTVSPKFSQVPFDLSTVYGVWIHGKGWLKTPKGEPFTDFNKAVVGGAASFFGSRARVVPFDDAMLELEATFIASEKHWLNRLSEWIGKRFSKSTNSTALPSAESAKT